MHASLIDQAVEHLRSGDRASARLLLEEAVRLHPDDEQAWLWMSGAVDTDPERLACLQQVLAIDPDNQAAQQGVQALSKASRLHKLDPQEASLETFLKEQEARHTVSSKPVPNKVVKQAVPGGKKADLPPIQRRTGLTDEVKSSNINMSELRGAGEARGMDWGKPGLSLALPLTRERAFGLPGFIKWQSSSKKRYVKNLQKVQIPWKQIPFNSTQITYFILGLIITFLLMLIGFSVLKTLVQGPRHKAAPPAVSPPLATPTVIPEPTPLVFNPTFVPSDCRFRIPPEAHVECFTMILPESRDGATARSIRLPLVIYRSLSPFPPPDPIVYLHGRGSAIEWAAENYDNFILPLLYQRDVVVIEPRGSGQSTPNLDCPELDTQFLIDLKNDPRDNGRRGAFVTAAQACRDRLASQGIRFSNFTTAAFAADIVDIAALLGYEQINLYGISYGSSVAQTVMREYPSIVRSAVLDSAFPLEARTYNSIASSAGYALDQLFEVCAENSACRSAYPNLEAVFNEVKIKLDEHPLVVPSTSPGSASGVKMFIDGTRFQQAILQALYSSVLIPEIPKGIYSARYGDTAFLEEALASPRLHTFDPSAGGMLPRNCLEQVYATSPDELEAEIEDSPGTSDFARYSIFGSAESLFGVCQLWYPAPFEIENKAPLYSSVPTLIFSGQLDPVVPPAMGEQVAAHLDRGLRVLFPALGHAPSALRVQECPLSLAAAFLHDPLSDLDPACGLEMDVKFTAR